eukprot:scaffold54780_cov50-Phaeocystis_antarctica.AAC.3
MAAPPCGAGRERARYMRGRHTRTWALPILLPTQLVPRRFSMQVGFPYSNDVSREAVPLCYSPLSAL